MIKLALLLGIYTYTLFFLGIFGHLSKTTILAVSILLVVGIAPLFKEWVSVSSINQFMRLVKKDKRSLFFFGILLLQAFVNLWGTLGPELAFDALWYHITLPKIYALNERVLFVPGGLLYYSAMPKLGEMLYLIGSVFGTEIPAKLIHFLFGVLSLVMVYKVSRLFAPLRFALLACVVYYANLVVAWESTSAYIDLIRSFFEVLSLYLFLVFLQKKKTLYLVLTAVILGLAVTTKLLSIGSIPIFCVLYFIHANVLRQPLSKNIIHFFILSGIPFLVASPWLLFSYLHTKNPFYPFFSSLYNVHISLTNFHPQKIVEDLFGILLFSPDPISPVYFAFIPIIFMAFKFLKKKEKLLLLYCVLSLIIWFVTPRTGGGRFILPFLPAWSVLTAILLMRVTELKLQSAGYLQKVFIVFICFLSFLSIAYRGTTNVKYLPVIVGKESESTFLSSHLQFAYGDFYDVDGFFEKNIGEHDVVLLYGFHNLFYVDFPYIDQTWVKPGDEFTFIATQNTDLPKRFSDWQKIYSNERTHVSVYSHKGDIWMF